MMWADVNVVELGYFFRALNDNWPQGLDDLFYDICHD